MTFGWHGFSLEHPADWAPVAVSGHRREGYVRIGSAGRLSLQVRWKSLGRSPDLALFLRDYFRRLERDAKRAGASFKPEQATEADEVSYGYRGATYGRGVIRQGTCGRVFVVEVASTENDSLKNPLKVATANFRSGGPVDLWSVLGLRLTLPAGLDVERREFLSGRTRLWLRSRTASIAGERWAFADELLKVHRLEDWARAVLDAEKATLTEEPLGLRLRWRPSIFKPMAEALVQHQPDVNQLVVVTSRTNKPAWRPEWDWLTA
ncbi:MAG: hypothetical protein ACO1SV_23765 [Fimbriimonas sp.]